MDYYHSVYCDVCIVWNNGVRLYLGMWAQQARA